MNVFNLVTIILFYQNIVDGFYLINSKDKEWLLRTSALQ